MALSTAWIAATPLMGVPDEPAHVIKAAAVVRGELTGRPMPGGGAFQLVTVPAGIAHFDEYGCFAQHKETTPACVAPFSGDKDRLVDARTSASNYNPVYYAIVGLPSLAVTGTASVYGMRIVNAVLSCLFLAFAFSALVRLERRKWAVAGLSLAMTPMVLFLNGAVNPNSLEYAAAAALLANLVRLLEYSNDRRVYPASAILVTVSASFLANTKGLSLLWLALMVTAACILGGWTRVKEVARSPWVWAGSAVIAASCAFALYWLVSHDSLGSNPFEGAGLPPLAGAEIMADRTFDYATGYVGQFGWLETPAPLAVHILWLALSAALVMGALLFARGRARVTTGFLLGALLLLPPLLQAQAVSTIGIVWQGRYILAVFVPLLIVAGIALDRAEPQPFSAKTAKVLGTIAALLAIAHFWTFASTLRRYVTGWSIDQRWLDMFLNPAWQPPGGALICLLVYAILLGLCLVLVRRAIRAGSRTEAQASPTQLRAYT